MRNVNQMRSVGKQLLAKQEQIKTFTRNDQVIDLLKNIDRTKLSKESEDYLDKLLEEVPTQCFRKNIKMIYDIVLAGDDLRVI